jgi:GNAT superfamily N-acetyltransferase
MMRPPDQDERFTLSLADAPGPQAIATIDDGLGAYNATQVGYWDARELAVLLTEPGSTTVLGGVLARTALGLLFINLVFLPEQARAGGIGRRMIQAVEAEAVRRGCRAATLCTINFQAPGFYEKLGYEEFGRVECDPLGTSRVFMRKQLRPAT